jgi:hypothetical protein
MLYQLPNGKVISITIDQYLELTDLDIQYLMSIDFGEHLVDPFFASAVETKQNKKYDFDYVSSDEELDNIPDDSVSFDDIIDLTENLDV